MEKSSKKIFLFTFPTIQNFQQKVYSEFILGRGENRFKDDQLEVLASLYGEDISIYKDMQDGDYLFKKIGYNDNPGRAIYLLELVIKAITVPSSNDFQKENLSAEN